MAARKTSKVGELWIVKVADSAAITLQRPDGSEVKPRWRDGYISHVLDIPGVYRCGDEEVTAT